MAGVSTKAINKLEQNKYKYNGIEQIGDLGLEDYDAKFRELDPQIGRWWQVDPKADASLAESPYVSMGNNPISHQDPLGDLFFGLFGSTREQRQAAREVAKETGGTVKNKLKRSISVEYDVVHQAYNPETGSVGLTVSHRSLGFRENGRPDFGNVIENSGYDKKADFLERNVQRSDGSWGPRPYPGTAEYFALEAYFVPIPPMLKILTRTKAVNFNPATFGDDIVRMNRATEGGGAILSGHPSSVVNSAMYYNTAGEQAASIFRSVISNHMFVDGNKRTAVAALKAFAEQNGLKTVSEKQLQVIASEVATGRITDVTQLSRLIIK